MNEQERISEIVCEELYGKMFSELSYHDKMMIESIAISLMKSKIKSDENVILEPQAIKEMQMLLSVEMYELNLDFIDDKQRTSVNRVVNKIFGSKFQMMLT
ncbi:hypothetical protein [Staphylococcus sp. GDY8P126P]|uniref:hypothetical protein n=1 Tax=Staphylococcus TaxID=1279 RepID=UPI001AEBC7BF|nr:hypothetical protein [Staphylococcus sp. GDY8P126P]